MRCPGQDPRFWKLDDIFDVDCPHCGEAVEFWKDEPSVKCPHCRRIVANPRLDLGCAQWCPQAEQCLGTLADPENILTKKLIRELQCLLGENTTRIGHALAVLKNAREIIASEHGDARVVCAAAILHTLNGPCPMKGPRQYEDSPDRAELPSLREILSRCEVDAEGVERICAVIENHNRGETVDCTESKVLWDAEWLARIADPSFDIGAIDEAEWVASTFRTREGRKLAIARLNPSKDGSPESSR